MFSTMAGITLDRDEHGSYDALEWSLYHKVSAWSLVNLVQG